MDLLAEAIKKFDHDWNPASTYWIAYSGGLDSHVLLHLLVQLRAQYPLLKLHAVHVDHGISPQAAAWVLHCAEVCATLGVDFLSHRLVLPSPLNSSPEDRWRRGRYQFLASLVQAQDMLLTAHHQDDQAETVLLQLLRGAGPKGLAAMPRIKTFAAGQHGRLLLDFTRADLLQYARHHQLRWIEDESNAQLDYARNFLRHEIMPILTRRWPSVAKTFARTAEHCAQAQQFMESTAQQLLAEVSGTLPRTLSVKKLLQLEQDKLNPVLRAWVLQAHFPLPSLVKIQQILQTVLTARADKMPCVTWGGVEVRRYRDNLFLQAIPKPLPTEKIEPWSFIKPLVLASGDQLQAIPCQGAGFLSGQIQSVVVRFRQGGETIQLAGRAHHQELKKLFQVWGVPPWQRDRTPLLYVNDQLIAVVGWGIAEGFATCSNELGWLCIYTPS